MDVVLHHLVDKPQWINQLALWFQNEWGYLDPETRLEDRIKDLSQRLSKTSLPLTIIATIRNELVGTYSLDINDMETHQHLSPWLASVFVNPLYRQHGIGSMLVQDAVNRAAELNIKHLYLFTPNQEHWYAKMGWHKLEESTYNKQSVVIMDIFLTRHSKNLNFNGQQKSI